MNIQKNVDLKPYNSFGFAAIAEQFVAITSEAELEPVIQYAAEKSLQVSILSGGSNILVSPVVEGIVVYMDIMGREVESDGDHILVTLGAGENWHETVRWSVEQGYVGIESMALIPGKVGAAPVQNIGAYGTELKDVFVSLKAYDCLNRCFVYLSNDACQFAYRDSVFKHYPGRFIITEVTLKLSQTKQSAVRYDALQAYFIEKAIENPSLAQVFQAICDVRSSKLPDPRQLGNAGSFFKNPVVNTAIYTAIKAQYPNLVAYADPSGGHKLAAGWLIDQCQWKGRRMGEVGVYEKQALVLVNFGEGTLEALYHLADEIQRSVLETFGVQLEIEPQAFPKV
jgi:UDP-N-acetylmuramate dehydrogenase